MEKTKLKVKKKLYVNVSYQRRRYRVYVTVCSNSYIISSYSISFSRERQVRRFLVSLRRIQEDKSRTARNIACC